MKLSISLKSFGEAVNNSSRAVGQKGVSPMLANLMITARDNEVKVVGSDDELMIISQVPAEIEEPGNFTIAAKLLVEVISSFPDANNTQLSLSIYPEKENQLIISSEKSEYDLQIQGIEDYPPVPVIEPDNYPSLTLDANILTKVLKEGSIATAEEGSPAHKSICIDFENEDGPRIASLDGKRLASTGFHKIDIVDELKQKFLLPSRSIIEIQKILPIEENIKIYFYKEHLVFSNSKVTLFSKLIDGRFPDYNRIFPSEYSRKAVINKREFSSALKAVLPIARLSNSEVVVVNMDINQNEMRLWADTPQFGSSEVFLPCTLEGEPMNTSFNAKFVQNFISVIEDEEIIIELTTPNYPGVLKPGNPESMFRYVVMPVIFVK